MKYKAIAIDLDGTAINTPDTFIASDRLKNAVENLEKIGIKVFAVTSREVYPLSLSMIRSVGITSPSATVNGSIIIDPVSGDEIWRSNINNKSLESIFSILKDMPNDCVWSDVSKDISELKKDNIKNMDINKEITVLIIVNLSIDEANELKEKLNLVDGISLIPVKSNKNKGIVHLHIVSDKSTKRNAINYISKLINVEKSEIIGIGDGPNDIDILESVGHKVAMGNAVPELKEIADEIIGDVSSDGLAEYFEKLINENLTKGEKL